MTDEAKPRGRPPKVVEYPALTDDDNRELLAEAEELVRDPAKRDSARQLGMALVTVKTLRLLKTASGEALLKAMDRWDRIAGPPTIAQQRRRKGATREE